MVIEEPKQKETFTQKKLRQQREVGRHTPYTPLPIKPTATKLYIYIYIYPTRPKHAQKSPPKPNEPHKKLRAVMPP